jgi:type IV pilus assembly protein PilM
MPKSPSRVAAVNLGMQTVTMAVFDATKDGGLSLQGFARAELVPDPAADGSRGGQLKIALDSLRTELGWKQGYVACAIPSQGVFARFVKIPKVEADKVDQVLLFEAQQNVPYPIEEVAWSFQVLPEKEPDSLNALIIATKTEQLETAVGAMREAKISPDLIETSPSALYNAFRYNYPDLQGCSLLIDLGARATNLLFIEGDEVFMRTLPIGGNSITAALHKKFEARGFAEVENFKCTEGLIPPPGNYAGAKSEEIAEMGKIARTVMTRIHNEITRSVTFYRTSQKGAAPMRVFLAGGGVSLPYTLEFFNEKLSLPIEFFNPLRRVGAASSVPPEALAKAAHTLGECVGLALRPVTGDCPLEITLKSATLEKTRTDKRRRPFLFAAAAVFLTAIGLVGLYYRQAGAHLEKVNTDLQAQIAPLEQLNTQISGLQKRREQLLKDSSDLAAAPIWRVAWVELLKDLNSRLPAKFIWVTKLSPSPEVPGFSVASSSAAPAAAKPAEGANKADAVTGILIEGLYLENPGGPAVVSEFVDALAKSELFDINDGNKDSVIQIRASQSGDAWAYNYKLLLPLKRPIPL